MGILLSLFAKKVKFIQLLCLNNFETLASVNQFEEESFELFKFYQNRQLRIKETTSMLSNESKDQKYRTCMHRVRLGMKLLTVLVLVDFLAAEKTRL